MSAESLQQQHEQGSKSDQKEDIFKTILGPSHAGGRGLTRRFLGPHLVLQPADNDKDKGRHIRFSKADRKKIRTLWKKELRRGKEGRRPVALNALASQQHPQITWQGSVFEIGKDIKTTCEHFFGTSSEDNNVNISNQPDHSISPPFASHLEEYHESSAPNTIRTDPAPQETSSTILKKQIVLFKEGWTPRTDLPKNFTEESMAQFSITWSGWQEVALVQEQCSLEFWFQHKLSMNKHGLKLKHRIPLTSKDCFCSLFSPTDLVLSLTYPRKLRDPHEAKTTRARRKLRIHSGTTVFLIQTRCQSAMYDLFWRIWMSMRGDIPDKLEFNAVPLDVKLLISSGTTQKSAQDGSIASVTTYFREEDIFRLARKNIRGFPQWDSLIDDSIQFKIAWKRGDYLSWIDQCQDDEGNARPWAILCAAVFNKITSGNKSLEIRPAWHYSTNISLRQGQELLEPSAIEGYTTLSSKKNRRERLYFHSHDNYVFFSSPSNVDPPQPPSLYESLLESGDDSDNHEERLKRHLTEAKDFLQRGDETTRQNSTGNGDDHRGGDGFKWKNFFGKILSSSSEDKNATDKNLTIDKSRTDKAEEDKRSLARLIIINFLKSETKRLHNIMISTKKIIDLREIESVQKVVVSDDSSAEVSGGRMHGVELRSIGGIQIRLEVNSEEVASELETSLSKLREYWIKRTEIDVRQYNTNGNEDNVKFERDAMAKILAEKKGKEGGGALQFYSARKEDEESRNEEMTLLLGNFFNRCILEGCRTIRQDGRVYEKKGFRGSFKEVLIVLVDGQLLRYDGVVKTNNNNGQQMVPKILHHRLSKPIKLDRTYVLSGKLCEDVLDKDNNSGTWNPKGLDSKRLPRVYEDGLMSVDGEDDCTFMLWHKRKGELGHKHTLRVFRARSKMECSRWVYAINCEIERINKRKPDK